MRAAGVYLLLTTGLLVRLVLLDVWLPQYAARLLDWRLTAMLLGGQFAQLLINVMATYLRAHREDPLMPLSILSAVCVVLDVVLVMQRYGLARFIGVEALVLALLILPLCFGIFVRHRDRFLATESLPGT